VPWVIWNVRAAIKQAAGGCLIALAGLAVLTGGVAVLAFSCIATPSWPRCSSSVGRSWSWWSGRHEGSVAYVERCSGCCCGCNIGSELGHVVIVDPLYDIVNPCKHLGNTPILAQCPLSKRGPLTLGEGRDPLTE